jgi:hypothetical protein
MFLMLYSPLDTALLFILLQPSGDGYFLLFSSKSSFRGTIMNFVMQSKSFKALNDQIYLITNGFGGRGVWITCLFLSGKYKCHEKIRQNAALPNLLEKYLNKIRIVLAFLQFEHYGLEVCKHKSCGD